MDVHPAGAVPAPPWLAFAELLSPGRAGGCAPGRKRSARRWPAVRAPADAVPLRVAVSVTHLGLAARLIAPAVAAAALGGLTSSA